MRGRFVLYPSATNLFAEWIFTVPPLLLLLFLLLYDVSYDAKTKRAICNFNSAIVIRPFLVLKSAAVAFFFFLNLLSFINRLKSQTHVFYIQSKDTRPITLNSTHSNSTKKEKEKERTAEEVKIKFSSCNAKNSIRIWQHCS